MKSINRFKNILIISFTVLIVLPGCNIDRFFAADSIKEEIDKALGFGFDGMILCVNQADKNTFYTGGWKDRDLEIPAAAEDLFKIASISKLYIAAAASIMVADGHLDLDQTLAFYIPEFEDKIEYSNEITLGMLIQHRSGIPNFTDHPDYPWSDPFEENSETYSLVFDQPADFKPNKKYRYSNTNYLLIGEIMDRKLGYSHHDFIQDEILNPLGLDHTYSLLADAPFDDVMSGYFVGYEDDIKSNDFVQPGGSMVATAEDVAIFLRALIDGTLLNSEEQAIYSSVYRYEHTGLLPGYQSIAEYVEELDAVVVLFTNTSGEGNRYWNEFQRTYNRMVRIFKKE